MITKIIYALTSPGTGFALLAALGTLLLWTRLWHVGRLFLTLGVVGLTLIIVLPVDQWSLAPLENQFESAVLPEKVDGIIVLGGAQETGIWLDRGQPALNSAADRMTEFAILARRYPSARLVFTGGTPPSKSLAPPEADVARVLLTQLGIAPERVSYEDQSTTTWENAVFSRALIRPKPDETWLLVTSASHIPRAVGAFRAVGWDVTPAPVGYKSYHDATLRNPRSFGEKLALLDIATHEWIGLVAYWAQGHSTTLFPAPR
jgi:uncharacterized SAM-binding protein YcdF (DUF218 family)